MALRQLLGSSMSSSITTSTISASASASTVSTAMQSISSSISNLSNLSNSYSSISSTDSWELSIGNLGVHDYNNQATDRLASTFRCAELLSDSPSTSSENAAQIFNSHGQQRRRSSRGVLQPVHQQSDSLSRPLCQAKRRSLDLKLNTPQHASIRTAGLDRGIHGNKLGFLNLLKAEEDTCVNSHYFEAIQEELEVKHREAAVDWLFDVSKDYLADPGVLPLAVSLMDRFLSVQQIYKKDIQALAGTCFFISSKMKEPQPLNARKMSDYTVGTVTIGNILSWELLVCSQLEWDLCSPTGVDFFDFVAANYPTLCMLRPAYLEILHRMQRSHKLALFVPSLQSCLSLLHAATNQECPSLLVDAKHCISEFFQIELSLLEPYLVDIDLYCLGKRPRCGQRAPPSSSEERSSPEVLVDIVQPPSNQQDVILSSCRNSLPATPLNDSGFCSSIGSTACSPDGTHRSTGPIPDIDSDCSPPKMRRLSSE